jgi:cell division GTPase FtsZ
VNILLLSTGGGGGNILRSLKALFARDVATAQETDAKYAERLRRAITTRFLDTNEFSLAQVPKDERVLIGAATTQRQGSRHNPELAERALEESRADVERLIAKFSVIFLIGTGGKGTGAGTMFPLAEAARAQQKLVIPVFVRPSFEQHEVDKRRFDHARHVAEQFDAAGIRLIEVLNDRAYSNSDPQPQSVVWERMNLPIARGLRGLLYVLWDLSQVDPSDLSILLAGRGRMRIGFAEINPASGREPGDKEIDEAVRVCWQNAYYTFSKPVGTSLVCIQGDWSNLADARIKGGLAALALSGAAGHPYNPLYARAFETPKPWGVTALFTEYTGAHEPLTLDWSVKTLLPSAPALTSALAPAPAPEPAPARAPALAQAPAPPLAPAPAPPKAFETVVEFAKALNRSDPAALALAANGPIPEVAVDGHSVRKLLGTVWFRSVFPHLSASWREHLLDALGDNVVVPNHAIRVGRQTVNLKDLTYEQLKDFSAKTLVLGDAGSDLQLLIAIGRLWGEAAVSRVRFVDAEQADETSRLSSLLGFRKETTTRVP